MENKTVYKIGDCFRNRHIGYIIRIVEVFESEDGIHAYDVQPINSPNKLYYTLSYTRLLTNYEYSPMAQVLYGNNVTTN